MLNIAKDKIYIISKKYGKRMGFDLPYFIKNGFWVAIRQIIGTMSGLALSIAFARLATQEILGQYQLILSILSVASILSLPGLNTALTQSAARGYDGDYRKVVKISFLWSLLGVPALLLVGGYYYLYQSHVLGLALMVSSVFFPFFYAPNTWDSFLQGKSRFDISTKYSSIQAIINTIATIGIIFFSRNSLFPILIAYLLSYTFFNGYYYLKSLKYIENEKMSPDTIRYGWFLTKINILGIISENLDRIIVGAFISPSSLAIYYVISFIPLKIKDAAKPFFNIFLPKLSLLEENIIEIIKNKKKIIFKFLFLIFILSVAYYFLIERVSLLFFGDVYKDYYHYSKYYFVLILLVFPLNILARYAIAVKNNKAIWFSNTLYPILRIFLSVALIYKYNIAGAVIAYNANIIIWLLLYVIGLRLYKSKS